MVDTTDNGFRAAIGSLRDIVLPAVDPSHPMAREQIALVIDWLEFQRTRQPLLRERQRAELAANLWMAREIAALGLALDAAGLEARIAETEAVMIDAAATFHESVRVLGLLEQALADAVTLAGPLDPADRAAVEQIVVRGSEPIIALQRAWFLPYGLEADPPSIPLLDDALALSAAPFRPAAETPQ